MIDMLKKISLKYVDEKFNELKNQFIEMGQLKSDFDIEKFTIKKEGNFIAHNFHFLMRQYHLALYEARRMLLNKEEKLRKLKEYEDKEERGETTVFVFGEHGKEEKYIDIEIRRLKNEIDLLEVSMTNKICMVDYFEKCRNALIKLNGGKAPTNKQYQNEEPKYWEFIIKRKALNQHKQRATGISEGLWDVIDQAEELPVLNENYKISIGSKFDINEIETEISKQKKLPKRLMLIEES